MFRATRGSHALLAVDTVAYALSALLVVVMAGCGAAAGGGGGGAAANGGGSDNGLSADPSLTAQTVSPAGGRLALVELNAGASSASVGEIVGYSWTAQFCGVIATGPTAEVLLEVGDHNLSLIVTDDTGATDETNFVVTVVDDRPAEVTLTTSVEGDGQTEPTQGTTTTHALDSTTTVTAIPDAGWRFSHWEGDSDAEAGSIAVVMDADKALTAVFEELPEGSLPRLHLPWGLGETRFTGQANNGVFSHQYAVDDGGGPRFAWDYTIAVGTPILAAAAGRVVHIIENVPNNPEGTVPDDPKVEANLVQIDHGNGLQTLYAHMDQFGVAVQPGQFVVRGQYLGRSGNSGFSTGPHLHYEALNTIGRSAPTGLVESSREDGITEEGDAVTSQNRLDTASLDGYVESTMPTDAFEENGIELFEPTVPGFFFNAGQTYVISGRVTDLARNVCLALVIPASANPEGTDETVFCESQPVDLDGNFNLDITFGQELVGAYLMGIVSGVGAPGGFARVNVQVLAPPPANQAPTITVEQPADDRIDYGGTGVLRASGSDADGDPLSFVWAQVSGPAATIADPTSPETEFTLAVGKGTTRVAFQVIASDGIQPSLPAEVVYRMPDNFHVRQITISDTECTGVDDCLAADSDTLSAERDRVTVSVTVLNLNQGDLSRFEIRDPSGEVVLLGRLCEPAERSAAESFWRFGWTNTGLTSEAGDWRAVYLRNGLVEASTTFTLAP